MSYIVDYGELDALMGAYNGAISIWRSAISTMKGQADAVKGSTNISGNSADRMRDYLDMTYSCASVTMSMVLEMFQKSFLLYTEAYHQQVDASAETHISEEELSEHRTSLQGKRSRMQQIALSAETAVSGISDLVALPSLDIGAADAEFSTILTSLDDLDAAVNGVESAYSSGGITEINDLLANSTAFLQEMCRQSEDFKTSFTAASFVGLASVPALMSSINNANAWLSANESQVSVAVEHLEQRLAIQQAEYEKRERRAKWAKAAVAVVAVVATTAAVATGVGTLLVPVICGVGKCAFNAAADEYVKHDFNTDQWDKAYIGKEAVKGWFSGFTSGILPPGTGDIVKAGLSSANSALWGGLDNAYDQMVTTGTISDTTSILFDAEKSGVSSFVGDLAGNAVSDQLEGLPIGMGLDKYTNPSDDVRHYIGKYVSGAVDKVSSGVAERFASTSVEIMYDAERNSLHGQDLLKGIDVGERYKGVLDLEKMGLDFATGGTKEVVSSHITEHTLDPDTGLTPILQAKLGYETNPETGFTAVVQDSLAHIVDEDEFDEILAGMEERNPSTGANAAFGADATGSSTGLSGVDGRNLSTGASESPTTAGNPSLSEALSDDKLFENNRPGEYTYQSSQFGKTASGSLDLTDNPQRDSAAQRAAGGADREAMDDGGHLIGARFKGASGSENLEAQNRDVNRGDYKRMENRWAEDLNEGNQVYVHVETYRPEGSERPEAYMGYSITENKDGTREWDAFSYENLSHAEQEEFERIISEYDD